MKPAVFASVSSSVGSTNTKPRKVQHNTSKMTGCFMKLFFWFVNILIANTENKTELLQAIRTFFDGIQMSSQAVQNLQSVTKQKIPSVQSKQGGISRLLQNAKVSHHSVQPLKPKQDYSQFIFTPSLKRRSLEFKTKKQKKKQFSQNAYNYTQQIILNL